MTKKKTLKQKRKGGHNWGYAEYIRWARKTRRINWRTSGHLCVLRIFLPTSLTDHEIIRGTEIEALRAAYKYWNNNLGDR